MVELNKTVNIIQHRSTTCLSHLWVCIYIERKRIRTRHFGRSLEMGIASGSHFLTPCSLRRPRQKPSFFLCFQYAIHNTTLGLLYNRLTSQPSLILMVYRAVEISLLSLSSSMIERIFHEMDLHKLPPEVRSRPYTHPFISQFLFVLCPSCCASWVFVSPRTKPGLRSHLCLFQCRKVLFFNGFSLRFFSPSL